MLTFHRLLCDNAMKLTHETRVIAFSYEKLLKKVFENGIKKFQNLMKMQFNSVYIIIMVIKFFRSFSNSFVFSHTFAFSHTIVSIFILLFT